MSGVEALTRAHRAISHPNDPRCPEPDLHTDFARSLLSNLSTADRLEIAGIGAFDWDQAEPALLTAFTDTIADNPPDNALMVTTEWALEVLTALSEKGYVLAALATTPVSDDTEGAG